MKLTAKHIKRLHLVAIVTWAILIYPSVTIWKDSVQWLIIISIYANIVGHLSGFGAARIERKEEKKDE